MADPTASSIYLTPRQLEILAKIAEGKSSKEIAAELGVGFKTIVTHRTNIMAKFEVHNVVLLVRRAISLGYIKP